MSREKRLGRGLEALLSKVAAFEDQNQSEPNAVEPNQGLLPLDAGGLDAAGREAAGQDATNQDDPERVLQQTLQSKTPSRVDIMNIERNPYQPRMDFDPAELDTLSASISQHGLLQPIVVRANGEKYQIIAGERRFRAAVRAGWSDVPVHVLQVDDRQMAELALTENIQRKDLNALEKANAFARYLEMYGGTHEELAGRLELDRSTVTNLIRLLDLPASIQMMLRKEELSPGHARALLPLEEYEIDEMARRIVNENWSVRQTERAVKELLESDVRGENNPNAWNIIDQNGNRQPVAKNEHLVALEQEFRMRLGTKVKLSQTDKGKGKLVIPFNSHEEFEQIYKWICKNQRMKDAG